MPLYRRSNVYRLRDHEIDPLITYDGIKTNPLPYSDCDTLADDDNLLCLAELYYEHWDISKTTEEIFLHDPFVLSSKDDIVHLKNKPHPLRWLYDLIKTEQLFLYYSSKQCTLTLVYSLILSRTKKQTFNVFTFYAYCKENSTTNSFFKHLFEFDNYQSILQMNTTTTTNNNNNTTAMNIIDFIYQEIQATTMLNIDDNNSLVLSKSLLKDDVIQLKVHQIKSINWMLKREQDLSSSIVYTPLHRCHDLFDNEFYVHIIYGVPLRRNEISNWNKEQFSLSGGILCDEMGL